MKKLLFVFFITKLFSQIEYAPELYIQAVNFTPNKIIGIDILPKKDKFQVANAGMPPCLHYRKKTNDIERIIIKSLPLGAPIVNPYNPETRKIESGDIILLMSDGLEELFNEDMEVLGIERIIDKVLISSSASSNQIAAGLFALGDKWRGKKQQSDDITFVIIKVM